MAVQHWMSFGTFAEQRFFIYPNPETYYGIVINGNMAAHAPDGLAGFLLEKTREKMPYIIDPLTHAFQHDPTKLVTKKKDGSIEIKSSISSLGKHYGEFISSVLGERPVLPRDFHDDGVLKDYTFNCLNFQKTHLSSRMVNSDVNQKYLEHTQDDLSPFALVVPYFYMTEGTIDQWLPIQIRSVNFAKSSNEYANIPIFVSLVLGQGVILREDLIKQILKEFEKVQVDGFLIWIDSLDEHNAGSEELKGLLYLVDGLRANDRDVINLHGSYFSILAGGGQFGKSYFTGVAHGPEFGETRPVMPVGGGIPIAKYYLKNLHNRVRYNDALNFLISKGWLSSSEQFHTNVCDCAECRSVLSGDVNNFSLYGVTDSKPVKRGSGYVTLDYPTKETKEHCLKHYLEMKRWEYAFASSASKDELIDDLVKGQTDFGEIAGLDFVSYLYNWRHVLQSLS